MTQSYFKLQKCMRLASGCNKNLKKYLHMINAVIFKLENRELKYIARSFLEILKSKVMSFIYGLQINLKKLVIVLMIKIKNLRV